MALPAPPGRRAPDVIAPPPPDEFPLPAASEPDLWPDLDEPAAAEAPAAPAEEPAAHPPGEPEQSFSFEAISLGGEPPPAPPAPAPEPPRPEPTRAAPGDEDGELEMLFGQPAAEPSRSPPSAGDGAATFKVRRPSGKVFGPFAERDITDMLGKGELLGNEDVSPDGGDTWVSIGAVPALAEAVRRLHEAPVVSPPVAARDSSRIPEPFKPRMESGLKDRVSRIPRKARRFAALAIALLVVAGVGVGGSFTRYGPFFWKALRGRSASPVVARLVSEGRTALGQDTYQGDLQAASAAEQGLRADSFDPQARLLLAVAASSLVSRGGDAAVARARELATEMAVREPESPEGRAAVLAARLAAGEDAAAAAAELAKLPKSDGDPEMVLLLARAAAARGDSKKAAALLDRFEVLRPNSSRAARARSALAVKLGDDKAARALLETALTRDPNNVAAALDLAVLMERAGDPGAEAALRFLSDKDRWSRLGPGERARVHLALADLLSHRPGAEAWAQPVQAELEAAVEDQPANVAARFALGRLLVRRGDPGRAVDVLKPAAAASRDWEVLSLYARALVQAGKALDARTAVDEALARSPDAPQLLYLKGWLEQQAGKRAEARKLYERAIERAPADWRPRLALGELSLSEGDLAGAASQLGLAAEKAPGEAEAQAGLGDLKLAQGDVPAAEAAYGKALELDPDSPKALVGRARVALARGDAAAARPSLAQAVRIDPRLAEAQLLLGWILWTEGDLERGRSGLEAAVALDPRNALAHARLGAARLEQGKADEALKELELATNLDAGLAEAQFWYGRALLVKGESKEALERLQKAAALAPGDPNHHLFVGLAEERLGQPGDAAEAYRAAIAAAPRLPDGYERLAMLYAAQGDFPAAAQQLQKAIEVAPRVERLRVELGDADEHLGKHAEAVTLYRQALQRDPKLVAAYYKIAQAVHAGQGLRAAVPWYEQAVKADPSNPMPHLYLGYAYKERGQRARAVQEFKTYLRARPDADDRKDVEREIEDLGG